MGFICADTIIIHVICTNLKNAMKLQPASLCSLLTQIVCLVLTFQLWFSHSDSLLINQWDFNQPIIFFNYPINFHQRWFELTWVIRSDNPTRGKHTNQTNPTDTAQQPTVFLVCPGLIGDQWNEAYLKYEDMSLMAHAYQDAPVYSQCFSRCFSAFVPKGFLLANIVVKSLPDIR